jgi:hypothetical protein
VVALLEFDYYEPSRHSAARARDGANWIT